MSVAVAVLSPLCCMAGTSSKTWAVTWSGFRPAARAVSGKDVRSRKKLQLAACSASLRARV